MQVIRTFWKTFLDKNYLMYHTYKTFSSHSDSSNTLILFLNKFQHLGTTRQFKKEMKKEFTSGHWACVNIFH